MKCDMRQASITSGDYNLDIINAGLSFAVIVTNSKLAR